MTGGLCQKRNQNVLLRPRLQKSRLLLSVLSIVRGLYNCEVSIQIQNLGGGVSGPRMAEAGWATDILEAVRPRQLGSATSPLPKDPTYAELDMNNDITQ